MSLLYSRSPQNAAGSTAQCQTRINEALRRHSRITSQPVDLQADCNSLLSDVPWAQTLRHLQFLTFFWSLLAQLLVSWSFNVKTKQRKGEQIAIGRRCWTIRMPKGLEICKYRGCFALLYYLCIKLSELVFGTLLKAGFSICQLSLNFYVGFILHVFCISILFAWHCKLEINLKNTR